MLSADAGYSHDCGYDIADRRGGRLDALMKDVEKKEANDMSSGGFMKQDRSPLTFRQQGIVAAVMGAAMLAFYTLVGIL
jgi:hypothetical protein